MKICVVGSGAREHALALALAKSADVVVTPGNPLIPHSVDTDPEAIDADLFVIGPEAPLVDGLADRLRAAGRLVFGPGADGAQLEGSKAWMKDLLVEAGVPTARHGSFTSASSAHDFLDTMVPPYVIKTDGLAAGKGVVVTDDLTEAHNAVDDYLSGRAFGDAGTTLVIEEGLVGREVSVFAVCDGNDAVLLPAAQDYKRVGDGDTGPNTGGMGAFSPAPLSDAILTQLRDEIVRPTLACLRNRGIDYRGTLFAGLMLTADGPKLLEYNVRFGDPETQVVVSRIESDVAQLLATAAAGHIDANVAISNEAMVTVVCAAPGYPLAPQTGAVITGLAAAQAEPGVTIFGAGVGLSPSGELVTAGGRVLSVTGRGATLDIARQRAYAAVAHIDWPGMVVRDDICASVPSDDTQ